MRLVQLLKNLYTQYKKYILCLFLDFFLSDILYLFVSLENRNSKTNEDVEENKEEEHLPLISQNQHDINESCVKGIG